jgi:putative oxidoreductase
MRQTSISKENLALALIRIVVGAVFLTHGLQKVFVFHYAGVAGMFQQMGIPLPGVSAALAMTAETLGGLLLLVGLYTRLAAIPVAFTMLVAIAQVHFAHGFFAQGGGFEYPLTLLVANIALVIGGGGAWALDNLRSRKPAELYELDQAKAA